MNTKDTMKKTTKQSKGGWGGKRAGAGAPFGNTNAVKHGERSQRAFFPLPDEDTRPEIVNLRCRNLMLADYMGQMMQEGRLYNGNLQDLREMMLIEGIMRQHTKKMERLAMRESRRELEEARAKLAKARSQKKSASLMKRPF
ncbi:hypothetical protein [Escherichia coli]|uniref:hypothetical protein n=1 Tax=Escherichia coli TaxID=562 RepID=UPI00207D3E42|nr:hypothetical protein [Escherichia coli]